MKELAGEKKRGLGVRSEQEAYLRLGTRLGLGAPVAGERWSLEEFQEGWLLHEDKQGGREGRLVIEKAAGRVVRFASSVASERIRKEYGEVRREGQGIEGWGEVGR